MVLLLLHGSGASIWNLVVLSHLRSTAAALVLLVTLRKVVASALLVQSLVHAALLLDHSYLLNGLGVRRLGDQGGSNQVDKHWLAIQLVLMRLSLLHNPIYALAQVSGLKMRASLRTSVLLAGVIVRVDTLVVIEINIVNVIRVLHVVATFEIVIGNVRD